MHRCCSSRCRNKCCHVDCWLSPRLSICAHAHLILFALECNNFRGSAITLAAVQYRLILHSNGPIRLQYLLQLYNKYIYIYIIYIYVLYISWSRGLYVLYKPGNEEVYITHIDRWTMIYMIYLMLNSQIESFHHFSALPTH